MNTHSTAILYLESIRRLFSYYKALGSKAMAQLKDIDMNTQANEESNSIAIIVKHLHGNMLSRWTDFLTTDGEKEWRNRDGEFEGVVKTRVELMKLWDEGWDCLFHALNIVKPEDLEKIIYIRNEGQTVMEAINRQAAHYCYHVGQIVYLAKELKGKEWISLSIPRGKSADFNKTLGQK